MAFLFIVEYDRLLRRERQFKDFQDPLHLSDDVLFRQYRFRREQILDLIEECDPILKRDTLRSHALPTHVQVLIALRFFASGTFQNVLGDVFGRTQSTISQVIESVTNILVEKARHEIKMPSTPFEINRTMQEFKQLRNFPRIIGAIDCTQVPIKAPSVDEYVYVNRKQFHSINVQIICDSKLRILNYVASYPGSSHDAFIWSNSLVYNRFRNGEYGNALLVGDSGYPLSPFLMTPIAMPTTPEETHYNNCHASSRVVVEQCNGVLKSRFRCLHKSGGFLQYTPQKSAKIIIACMVLHNHCIARNVPNPADLLDDEGIEIVADICNANAEENMARAVRQQIVRDLRE